MPHWKEGFARRWTVFEILVRFLIGGVVISLFALSGDVLKPKSFAGLFSAAPSVALATLALTIVSKGKSYAAVEAHCMIIGAVAFFAYARCVSRLLIKHHLSALAVSLGSLLMWFGVAFGIWSIMR
jgi:Protein of unknown function (DUF3147)